MCNFHLIYHLYALKILWVVFFAFFVIYFACIVFVLGCHVLVVLFLFWFGYSTGSPEGGRGMEGHVKSQLAWTNANQLWLTLPVRPPPSVLISRSCKAIICWFVWNYYAKPSGCVKSKMLCNVLWGTPVCKLSCKYCLFPCVFKSRSLCIPISALCHVVIFLRALQSETGRCAWDSPTLCLATWQQLSRPRARAAWLPKSRAWPV